MNPGGSIPKSSGAVWDVSGATADLRAVDVPGKQRLPTEIRSALIFQAKEDKV
jgi:hypothetical protein